MDIRFSHLALLTLLSFGALMADESPEVAAAEQHMSRLVQGRTPTIRCLSLEDIGPVHYVAIFETGDPNYQYVLSYTRRLRGDTEPRIFYRVASSDLPRGTRPTLYTETEISLRFRANYGRAEHYVFDGALRARKNRSSHWYRLTEPFVLRSANISLAANALVCSSVAQ